MSCAAKLLAYCVVQNSEDHAPSVGVRGAPLQSMQMETLRCIYSPLIPPQEFNQDDALRFHAVLNSVFDQQSIIPFRFPTLLQNETALQEHLREKLGVYSADLHRLSDMVQMELRIAANQEYAAPASSGIEYLQSKQQHSRALQTASRRARDVLGDLVAEWKERDTVNGLRCYALVERSKVTSFRQKMQATNFSGPCAVLSSGPWPATEFLHE